MPLIARPMHSPFLPLRASVLSLALLLGACISNPPSPPVGNGSLPLAVQLLASDLTTQINPNVLERMKRRKLVLDPFIDAKSGQQTKTTRQVGELFAHHLGSLQSNLDLHPFDTSGVEQADYLIAGTLQHGGVKSKDYQLVATITERRTGLVIARSVSRVNADEVDATPTAFFADSPSLVNQQGVETAFSQIVALGLGTNNLAVRLLFNPGTTDFWKDPAVSGAYPMWLRHIARETMQGDYCLNVVGHTSRTGTENANARLSLARAKLIRDALVQNDRQLSGRVEIEGVGWRDNIIGSGSDDSRDSLDRRVEFKVKGCK